MIENARQKLPITACEPHETSKTSLVSRPGPDNIAARKINIGTPVRIVSEDEEAQVSRN